MNVGAAEIDVTPGFSVDLAGFASRAHPSVGVLEPIHARALCLHDPASGEKLLWLACDVIALRGEFVAAFRTWAEQALGLEGRQVLISATHTHGAPATIDLNGAGRFSPRYAALLRQKLEIVSAEAMAQSTPCRTIAASAPLELARHRRGPASAHVDPVVWALGFERESDGTFAAALLNYAMHPVALGQSEERISPDWCGAASAALSATLPGRPIALVTNGAAGNLDPPTVGTTPLEVSRMGRSIGHLAADALKSAASMAPASPLQVRTITIPLPLDWMDVPSIKTHVHETIAAIQPGWEWETVFQYAVSSWGGERMREVMAGGGREFPIEIQVVRLGELVTVVAATGELFCKFTTLLRQAMGRDNLFVVGYANGAFGYVPSLEAYGESGYEVDRAHFFYNTFRASKGGLELLADHAAQLVRQAEDAGT